MYGSHWFPVHAVDALFAVHVAVNPCVWFCFRLAEGGCTSIDSVAGSTVKFEGKIIMTESRKGLSCVKIEIYEEDPSFMRDDRIALGMTENDGTFSIEWIARQMDDWDDSVEIYAKFEGTKNYRSSRTKVYKIRVPWYVKKEK